MRVFSATIDTMKTEKRVDMVKLRQALEDSWDAHTSYLGVFEHGNPALGNCYPTSRVIQHYFPEIEIVEGAISAPKGIEKHFWNMILVGDIEYHIDLTWQQFPKGSYVMSYIVRDRNELNDGEDAIRRVQLLQNRVQDFLSTH
jgi:hypothetical protein